MHITNSSTEAGKLFFQLHTLGETKCALNPQLLKAPTVSVLAYSSAVTDLQVGVKTFLTANIKSSIMKKKNSVV